MPRKRENKNYCFTPILSGAEQIMPKKKAKKLNKLKNIIMASFQAKIFWKRPKNRETKNYRFVPPLPDALYKIPKKQQ